MNAEDIFYSTISDLELSVLLADDDLQNEVNQILGVKSPNRILFTIFYNNI